MWWFLGHNKNCLLDPLTGTWFTVVNFHWKLPRTSDIHASSWIRTLTSSTVKTQIRPTPIDFFSRRDKSCTFHLYKEDNNSSTPCPFVNMGHHYFFHLQKRVSQLCKLQATAFVDSLPYARTEHHCCCKMCLLIPYRIKLLFGWLVLI